MKVTHLNTYTEGGAAEAALRIHAAVLKQNINSTFLALYKGENEKAIDFRDELNLFENYILKIKNKSQTIRTRGKYSDAKELFSEINTAWNVRKHSSLKNSDILHLHWISSFVDLESFFEKQDKKIAWTLHDHFPFSGGFHYPVTNLKKAWSEKIEEQKSIIKKIFSQNKIDFIFPSYYLMNEAKNSDVLGNNNCHLIKNPVDSDLFKILDKINCRNKYNISKNKPVLFFLADHFEYPRKGFNVLKESLNSLDTEVTLLTAGRGNLPAKIGKAEIKPFGLVQNKNLLVELYNCSDLLINPSLADISSNTVIEAMSCGIPSVVFNIGGIPELINETNGLIAESTSPEALTDSINSALNKNYNREEIRNSAIENHSYEIIGKKYADLYSKF